MIIGRFSDPYNLVKEFKELRAKAGLPVMRFHNFPHTWIMQMLNDVYASIDRHYRWYGFWIY
jgi:integrase